MQLEPLASNRRVDEIFEQLRSQIVSGAIAPGSRLPNERDLAGTLGVNRGSIREALKRLEFLELVEVRHGQGTFVQNPASSSALQLVEAILRDPAVVTRELLEQLLEFRRRVSLDVVELAALHRTGEHLARARALLEREEREGADPERALEIDLLWNGLIGEATGNLLYQLVANLFTKLIARLGPLYYNERRDHRRSMVNHREALAAIESGDGARARAVVAEMLGYSEAAILREIDHLERTGVIGRGPGARR